MYHEATIRDLPKFGWAGGLCWDEMSLSKDLLFLMRCGEFDMVGITDLDEGPNAMNAMSDNKSDLQLADHALQNPSRCETNMPMNLTQNMPMKP